MNPYDHIKIENYWQKKWEEDSVYRTDTHSSKPTFFGLVEFPYPSGAGLHVGHVRSYTGMDVIVRKRRMEGFETLFPIGWDAFGLPAENYAIKTGIHPSITTRENIDTFRTQLKSCGFSFDWDREVDTTDPTYYKWTQWIFLKLYEKGLAYKKEMPVNWCPKDKCVLANEEVVDGKCERCGAVTEKRNKEQWMLAITKYAERLDKDLDDTTFLERIKIQQRNWIGMSEGSEIDFKIKIQTSSKKKVLIGTRNNAKFQMLTACFPKDLNIEFINLNDIDVDDSSLVEGQDFRENAKIKSQFYFKATGIPTISTDHILWLEKWPKDDGYMIHVRKEANPESARATDEETIAFLKKWVNEVGGKSPAHFEYAGAFTDESGTKGFVSLQRDYILQSVQSEKFWPGYPTESLLLDVETGEYKGDQENSFRYAGLIKDLDREARNWFASDYSFKVYTTRADTLFGCTYCVLAPEHSLVKQLLANGQIANKAEVEKYINEAIQKIDIDRSAEGKEKTGVKLEGVMAINPANQKEVPIFIADYVLATYGTGAIMAVPAHDERDGEFAKKYNENIEKENKIDLDGVNITKKTLEALREIYEATQKENVNFWLLGGLACAFYAKVIYRAHSDIDLITKDEENYIKLVEILEKLGYEKVSEKVLTDKLTNSVFRNKNGIEVDIGRNIGEWGLQLSDFSDDNKMELEGVTSLVISKRIILELKKNQLDTRKKEKDAIDWKYLNEFENKKPIEILDVVAPFTPSEGEDAIRPGYETINRHVIDVILENDKKEILLLIDNDKDTGRKVYHFIGGGVEEGSTPLETVYKETCEESGYTDIEIIGEKFSPQAGNGFKPLKNKNQIGWGFFYHTHLLSENRVTCEVEEGKHQMGWFSKDEVSNLITWPHHRAAWNNFLAGKNVMFSGDGMLVDSGEFDGLMSAEARIKITEAVGGKLVKKSKLRDWIFARQRYWGEPIPLVYDKNGKLYPVHASELPVTLPQVEKYEPTDNGESPLSHVKDWVNVKGEIDEDGYFHSDAAGEEFRRETDTMPQWAGSSWYFMRYIDPRNDQAIGEKEMLMKWLPVTWYNGGMEHTTLHLLYSRFWYKFLFDIGLTPTSEPYMKRTSQGMILGTGGVKMSKSLGNVINPDIIVKKFGADTLRMYEMFIGPFDQAVAWDDKSVIGIRRFVERVYSLRAKVSNSENALSITHKTIKKIGEDIEVMAFNTAISSLMICLNEYEKEATVPQNDFKSFLKLLAPFAPFIVEELWKEIGESSSIHKEIWPKYDELRLIDNNVTYVLQVNGKLRGDITLPRDTSKEEVLSAIKALDGYLKYVGDGVPKQQIFIPGKLVNIVI